jgi:iron transport multicopper oxidase
MVRGSIFHFNAETYLFTTESTVITIGDWYVFYCVIVRPLDNYDRYHIPARQVTIPPLSDSALINGKGRYAGGPPSPLAVVHVRAGKRYRIRLVSISCDPNYVFSIDGHSFTVIEADGVNTQPLPVDSIQIFAGSFDFLQPLTNFN